MIDDEDEVITKWVDFVRLPLGSKIRARDGMVYEHVEESPGLRYWVSDPIRFRRNSNGFVLPVTLVHRA